MKSEFGRGPSPNLSSFNACCTGGTAETCEAAFWASMDELVPVFEREGITLNLEPHPEDFVEALHPAVDMIRSLDSKHVRMLCCAPHMFHMGSDPKTTIERTAPALAHVPDSFDHPASSGLRYIVNPRARPRVSTST